MLTWIPPEETIRVPDITGIGVFTTSSSGSYLVHHKSTSKIRRFKSSNMPKASKKSVREQSPPSDDHNSTDSVEVSDSDHNQDPEVSFHPVAPSNQVPAMYMPYIEGPNMNWMVDDGLYHRFLK